MKYENDKYSFFNQKEGMKKTNIEITSQDFNRFPSGVFINIKHKFWCYLLFKYS